jgi:hypothetical protein
MGLLEPHDEIFVFPQVLKHLPLKTLNFLKVKPLQFVHPLTLHYSEISYPQRYRSLLEGLRQSPVKGLTLFSHIYNYTSDWRQFLGI